MSGFAAKDPQFESRVRESFGRQQMMHTIGAEIAAVSPGLVSIKMPCAEKIGQQHGFVHGGAVATIADSACGYAALSLMPPGVGVLTVEFKINFIAPAAGDELLAVGRVEKPGRSLMVCSGEVFAMNGADKRKVAMIVATMMVISGNGAVQN